MCFAMRWILLLFTAVPITEMYLLITVGGYIGGGLTILCVMLTAVIGVSLLRWQGTATLQRGMSRVGQGQLPGQEIAEGMMLAVAGALLLTPGFVTDSFGFLLLVPPVRQALAALAKRHLKVVDLASGAAGASFGGQGWPGSQPGAASQPGHVSGRSSGEGPVIIEGEYEERP